MDRRKFSLVLGGRLKENVAKREMTIVVQGDGKLTIEGKLKKYQ